MTKPFIIGLIASAATISSAGAQGFLGERYTEINAGYERLSLKSSDPDFSATFDGWGVGTGLNLPLIRNAGPFGLDLAPSVDFIRGTESDVTLSLTQVGALLRGYFPLKIGDEQGMNPFAGVGANYAHVRASAPGFESAHDSSVNIPAEVGIEFVTGEFSLTPFFRYNFSTESDWDDYWALGARIGWLGDGWGAILSVSYTDFDDGVELLGIRAGLVFAF